MLGVLQILFHVLFDGSVCGPLLGPCVVFGDHCLIGFDRRVYYDYRSRGRDLRRRETLDGPIVDLDFGGGIPMQILLLSFSVLDHRNVTAHHVDLVGRDGGDHHPVDLGVETVVGAVPYHLLGVAGRAASSYPLFAAACRLLCDPCHLQFGS